MLFEKAGYNNTADNKEHYTPLIANVKTNISTEVN